MKRVLWVVAVLAFLPVVSGKAQAEQIVANQIDQASQADPASQIDQIGPPSQPSQVGVEGPNQIHIVKKTPPVIYIPMPLVESRIPMAPEKSGFDFEDSPEVRKFAVALRLLAKAQESQDEAYRLLKECHRDCQGVEALAKRADRKIELQLKFLDRMRANYEVNAALLHEKQPELADVIEEYLHACIDDVSRAVGLYQGAIGNLNGAITYYNEPKAKNGSDCLEQGDRKDCEQSIEEMRTILAGRIESTELLARSQMARCKQKRAVILDFMPTSAQASR